MNVTLEWGHLGYILVSIHDERQVFSPRDNGFDLFATVPAHVKVVLARRFGLDTIDVNTHQTHLVERILSVVVVLSQQEFDKGGL